MNSPSDSIAGPTTRAEVRVVSFLLPTEPSDHTSSDDSTPGQPEDPSRADRCVYGKGCFQRWGGGGIQVYHIEVSRKAEVIELLNESEATTGSRVSFVVSLPNIVGEVLITVYPVKGEPLTRQFDLVEGLTPAKKKLILDWFRPLAMANTDAP